MTFEERIMAQAPKRLLKQFAGKSPAEIYYAILFNSTITDDEYVKMVEGDGMYGGTLAGFKAYYNRIYQALWGFDLCGPEYSLLKEDRERRSIYERH